MSQAYGSISFIWVKEFGSDPLQAFPGHGQMKPEQLKIEWLRREVNKLKAERDILKRPRPSSRGKRQEVRLHREAPEYLAGGMAMQCNGRVPVGRGPPVRKPVMTIDELLGDQQRDRADR